jgi:glycerol uptake facilitator-like aquaporin
LLARRLGAEFVGTALLLIAVVGSGIAAQRLSPNDVGLELIENSIATGAALAAIILAVGPVSGAHLNPAVSLADRLLGGLTWRETGAYCVAQVAGGAVGTVIANLIFSLAPVTISTKMRSGPGLWLAEVVATFGLLLVIFGVVRSGRSGLAPFAVGAYIASAYWFTASTSFANPAVTLARTLTDTFAGIAPASVVPFIAAQLVGALAATALARRLYPTIADVAEDLVIRRSA